MTKTITDPVQAILAEELAGQTENWSDLAAKITRILRDQFEITERQATSRITKETTMSDEHDTTYGGCCEHHDSTAAELRRQERVARIQTPPRSWEPKMPDMTKLLGETVAEHRDPPA